MDWKGMSTEELHTKRREANATRDHLRGIAGEITVELDRRAAAEEIAMALAKLSPAAREALRAAASQ